MAAPEDPVASAPARVDGLELVEAPPPHTRPTRPWICLVSFLGVVLFGLGMRSIAPDYAEAQRARTTEELKELVAVGQVADFKAAALLDFGFATSYAFLATSLAWSVDRSKKPQLAWFAGIASALVAVAAVIDLRENQLLLETLGNYHDLEEGAQLPFARLGPIKWGIGLIGGASVAIAYFAAWKRGATDRGIAMPLILGIFRSVWNWLREKALMVWRRRPRVRHLQGIWKLCFGSEKKRRTALAILAILVMVGIGVLILTQNLPLGLAILLGFVLHLGLLLFRRVFVPWCNIWWLSRWGTASALAVACVLTTTCTVLVCKGSEYTWLPLLVGAGAFLFCGVAAHTWRHSAQRQEEKHWGTRILLGTSAAGIVSLLGATFTTDWPWLIGIGVALLVSPLGLALIAQDAKGAKVEGEERSRRLLQAVVAIASGVAALSLLGIGPIHAIATSVALMLLVALIASDSLHDVILVLVVVLVIWSLEPSRGGPEPDPEKGRPVIVAFGDSYMSGEGANTYYDNTNHDHGEEDQNLCRRAPSAYPVLVGDALNADNEDRAAAEDRGVLFLACSGAKAADVITNSQYPGEPHTRWSDREGDGPATADKEPRVGQPQLVQAVEAIEALDLKPEYVLISIGGNDAKFGDIGMSCGLPGNCAERGAEWLENLDKVDVDPDDGEDTRGVRQRVNEAYETIRDTPALDGAKVIVIPYPVPLNESGCRASLLRPDEHRFLVGFTNELNDVLRAEAARAGFEFLEGVSDVYMRDNRRVCDVSPSEAAVNQLAASPIAGLLGRKVVPSSWFHNAFHPNEIGHELIACEVVRFITGNPPAGMECPEPSKQAKPDVSPPGKEQSEATDQASQDDAAMQRALAKLEDIMGAGFSHCSAKNGVRIPATCHDDLNEWNVDQGTRMLWTVLVPALLIVYGTMQLSIDRLSRSPEHSGRDATPIPSDAGGDSDSSAKEVAT